MKTKLGILALMCLLACACAPKTPWDVTKKPILYEQYVVYGGYQDVLAAIDAKVEQCMQPVPHKGFSLLRSADVASMYFFSDSAWARLAPELEDALCCEGLTAEEANKWAYLVLKLRNLDEERTQIDAYANDLSKLAWPRLRRSIQYGAEANAGCPDSPQADLEH